MTKLWPLRSAAQHGKLMPQRQTLQLQIRSGPHGRSQAVESKPPGSSTLGGATGNADCGSRKRHPLQLSTITPIMTEQPGCAIVGDEPHVLRSHRSVGIQWNTQVTLQGCAHLVSQVYCSALPVAYASHPPELWESLARLVLEAAYETTLCAAVLNRSRTGNNVLFLTLLGGGAFGNETEWITVSLRRALRLHCDSSGARVQGFYLNPAHGAKYTTDRL